ncbi:hypothetical protein JCM3766R1_006017 [Sporobolomyces carnicolor]
MEHKTRAIADMKSKINAIVVFCKSRGDKGTASWQISMQNTALTIADDRVKVNQFLRALGWAQDRVKRGEPIMIQRGKGLGINSSFDCEAILSSSFRSTVRQDPLCDPFLAPEFYQAELKGLVLTHDEFERAVHAIAGQIAQTEPENATIGRRCRHATWKSVMINRSHDRKYQTNKGDVLSFVRKNLIDQAERVRNWEMLYDPDDLFSRVGLPFIRNEAPMNWLRVPPAHNEVSHSLGRIGRRRAQEMGYEGQEAEDGGLVF